MVNRSGVELDALWSEHVGSRKIFVYDEVRRLRYLQDKGILSSQVIYQLFLTSRFWKSLRARILRRDKRCVKCKSMINLHVDHIRYPDKIGGESMKDLQVLCYKCHEIKTEAYDMEASRIVHPPKVGADGQLFAVLREVKIL